MTVETVNIIISLATIGLQIAIAVCVVLIALRKGHALLSWIGERGVLAAYGLAFVGMLGSLYYSEVALFAPCVLCWYQRIFMYANVFVLGLMLFKQDKSGIPYAMLLGCVGGLIALYHVMLPLFPQAVTTCSPASSISCAETYFTMFGYITIPVISLTSFAAICGLLFLANRYVRTR